MLIFILIFGSFFAAAAAGIIYAVFGIRRFGWLKRMKAKHRVLSWCIPLLAAALMVLFTVRHPVIGVIACIHLLVFWILADVAGLFISRRHPSSRYWQGVLAVAVTVVYLSFGWYQAHHVVETDYTLTTQKELGQERLRIAQISDAHMGSTFHADQFDSYMDRIQAAGPDLVVVTGDFVDDDTTKEDMEGGCRALGKLKAKYGVWFIYGNHDRGYYRYRKFTHEELASSLKENEVGILADEKVMLGEHICLIGREDRSVRGRASMEILMQDADPDRYTVVLDHQPHDFAAQAALGVDLVLCGHTHGGQMFPVGLLGEWSGANEKTYGLEMRGSTAFIVNSGISDWAIPFKTGALAEYGIIDIRTESN